MRHVSILLAAALLAAPAASPAAGKDEAKERFAKGVELFKNNDFEGALVEFMEAYEAKPHYAVRYNISMCLYKLHRYARAQVEMEAYLSEGGDEIPADQRAEIEGILGELEDLVGTLDVTCNVPGASLELDGKSVATLPLDAPLRLDVGEYDLRVSADGHEPYSTTITLPGGKEQSIEVELQPVEAVEPAPEPAPAEPEPRKKVPPAAFWAVASLTVAAAAGASIAGGLALAKRDAYADLSYDDDWKAAQSQGRSLVISSNVLWGVTGAAGLTALVLAFFTDFGGGKDEKASLTLTPSLDVPGLVLGGTF